MSFYRKSPQSMRAYRAKWAEVWQARLNTGAVSADEEEAERKALLSEVAGTESSMQLTKADHAAVMMALAMELGNGKPVRDPYRMSMQAKIGHLANELRPEHPEAYIETVVRNSLAHRDAVEWRKSLTSAELKGVMLKLETQARKNRKAGK